MSDSSTINQSINTPLIYPSRETNTPRPSPQEGAKSWNDALAKATPQGGLLNENNPPK